MLDGVSILHTDSMKWVTPVIRGASAPTPRIRHAAACCRDKVFIFGGQVSFKQSFGNDCSLANCAVDAVCINSRTAMSMMSYVMLMHVLS